MLIIVITLLGATATRQSRFSSLRQFKTFFKNNTGAERLNGLSTCWAGRPVNSPIRQWLGI